MECTEREMWMNPSQISTHDYHLAKQGIRQKSAASKLAIKTNVFHKINNLSNGNIIKTSSGVQALKCRRKVCEHTVQSTTKRCSIVKDAPHAAQKVRMRCM
jgi:hypothetical protein